MNEKCEMTRLLTTKNTKATKRDLKFWLRVLGALRGNKAE
jgi:hypothetical protein